MISGIRGLARVSANFVTEARGRVQQSDIVLGVRQGLSHFRHEAKISLRNLVNPNAHLRHGVDENFNNEKYELELLDIQYVLEVIQRVARSSAEKGDYHLLESYGLEKSPTKQLLQMHEHLMYNIGCADGVLGEISDPGRRAAAFNSLGKVRDKLGSAAARGDAKAYGEIFDEMLNRYRNSAGISVNSLPLISLIESSEKTSSSEQ